jgi:hypothetical protein
MTFAERKTLRLNLLKELYDYHFANNCNMFGLRALKEEAALAYKYLECKGFIAYSDCYQHGSIAITPAGIDYIEENHNN